MDCDAWVHDLSSTCFHLFGRIVLFSGVYSLLCLVCIALGWVFFVGWRVFSSIIGGAFSLLGGSGWLYDHTI